MSIIHHNWSIIDVKFVCFFEKSEEDSKEDIQKSFKLFDFDHTGRLSLENLKRVAHELEDDRTEEELLEMLQEADVDGRGYVNEDDFVKIIRRKI